jgi:hypothetical protein
VWTRHRREPALRRAKAAKRSHRGLGRVRPQNGYSLIVNAIRQPSDASAVVDRAATGAAP